MPKYYKIKILISIFILIRFYNIYCGKDFNQLMLSLFVKRSLKMVVDTVCKSGFANQSLHEINKLSFEEAVKHLNLLQSNAAYLQQAGSTRVHTKECLNVKDTEKYLTRCGITLESLDNLKVIHVTGTKGKGSACALCESILRAQGYKTGFFSSPHLVSVTERIRISGRPINRDNFSRHFWNVYSSLKSKRPLATYWLQKPVSIIICYGEDCIKSLNLLQTRTNLKTIATAYKDNNSKLENTRKYLIRSGISLNVLDTLNVIHITGTKGKGSTCAFCESILRAKGFKTGMFLSPHLVSVRERIMLGGQPISQEIFTKYFHKVFNDLNENQEHEHDMPPYFKFLTVLAFNIFISEGVDVAIIEVGIGGEYDCTNVLRNVSTVGITSLGLEHTGLLGNTIEQIAWQKAGIMKPGCTAFTVRQTAEAMNVIQNRAIEKECKINVIPEYNLYKFEGKQPELKINTDVQKINASLAIQMAQHWISVRRESEINTISNEHNGVEYFGNDQILNVPEIFAQGLTDCFWPGRCQIFDYKKTRLYLDGAHTFESMQVCIDWFQKNIRDNYRKVLLFNITGDRDSTHLLQLLHKCNFNEVIFVPNIAFEQCNNNNDQTNYSNPVELQMDRCKINKELWLNIQRKPENKEEVSNGSKQLVHTFNCVSNVLKYLNDTQNNDEIEVLVTGSLHLIGSVLAVVDPHLTTSYNI